MNVRADPVKVTIWDSEEPDWMYSEWETDWTGFTWSCRQCFRQHNKVLPRVCWGKQWRHSDCHLLQGLYDCFRPWLQSWDYSSAKCCALTFHPTLLITFNLWELNSDQMRKALLSGHVVGKQPVTGSCCVSSVWGLAATRNTEKKANIFCLYGFL